MIVDLIGSVSGHNTEEDTKYLKHIIKVVEDNGNVISRNWVEMNVVREKTKVISRDWRPFVEGGLDSIKQSDLVIADLTNYTFGVGYLVAAAMDKKKPILALTRNTLANKAASGIQDILFSSATYSNEADLNREIIAFFKQNTVHTKDLRFNMFLTREIVQYLDRRSAETGVNRSAIVRKLIHQKFQQERLDD